ncbi:MAG: phosphatase PAP2 family protein [Prevotella sp.]|nr:phosphatase PAP2 family protein [Prevotella sp.]
MRILKILMLVVLMVYGMLTPVAMMAQSYIDPKESFADPDPDFYLSVDQISDLLKWLPAPPDTLDEAFAHDIMRYFWGKTQRLDPDRAQIAIRDANFNMDGVSEAFSVPFGLPISEDGTPEIYKLLERGLNTIDLICIFPKEYYGRQRPFMRMHEQSLVPEDEPSLSLDGSYPSGHTIRGWGAALLMVEINPAAADTLFARGLMYGDSRLIVGAHWQSDVDAGRLAASAAYALLHTSPAFVQQMAKAQAEFRRLKGLPDLNVNALVHGAEGDGCEYTLSGTPATPQTRGIVIRDSQKVVRR